MKFTGKSDTFEVFCESCDITELNSNGSGPLGGEIVECPKCEDDALIENDGGIIKVYGAKSINSKIVT